MGAGLRRRGFTVAELSFALLGIAALAATTAFSFTALRNRVQDRTIEQGLVQLASDAVLQASYTASVLDVAVFEAALASPSAPEVFYVLVSDGPSTAYWEVAVDVSDDGQAASLAARTYTDRCVVASVTADGTVEVSRPRELSSCAPAAPTTTPAATVPVWSGAFTPPVDAGQEQVTVGWSASDVTVPSGGSAVTMYVASASPTAAGTSGSCAVFPADAAATTVDGTSVGFSCTITGLTGDVIYDVTVVAHNDAGVSAPSNAGSATPSARTVSAPEGTATTGSVTVSWTVDGSGEVVGAADGGDGDLVFTVGGGTLVQTVESPTVVAYRVQRATVSGGVPGAYATVADVPTVSGRTVYRHVDTTVTDGVTYVYRLVSLSSAGVESAPSSATRQLTPLARPTETTVSATVEGSGASARQLTVVEWDEVASASGYVVSYRQAGSSVWLPASRVVSAAAPGCAASTSGRVCQTLRLPAGATFEFRVSASTSSVSAQDLSTPSAPRSGRVVAAPAAPTLTVSVSEATPTLAWTPSSSATSHRVDRRVGAGSFTAVTSGGCGTLSGSARACSDTSAPAGTLLTYRVVAVNAVGSSTSNEGSVTAVGEVTVSTSAQSSGQVTVSWSAPGASRYDLYVCQDASLSGGCAGVRGTVWPSATDTEATSVVLTAAGGVTSLTCTAGTCGVTKFTVVARNTDGSAVEGMRAVTAAATSSGFISPPSPLALVGDFALRLWEGVPVGVVSGSSRPGPAPRPPAPVVTINSCVWCP